MNRYIGDIENIKPSYNDIELLYITIEQWQDNFGKYHHQPSFWLIYKGWMYLGVCNYEMEFLMTYDDILLEMKGSDGGIFNQFDPGVHEFDWLVKLGVSYHRLDYEKVMVEENLRHYSQYEIDFITIWNRDRKINKLIGL